MAEDTSDLSPEERSRRLLERIQSGGGASPFTTPEPPKYDPDLIPESDDFVRSSEEQRIDAVLDNIDIIDAYVKFIGKMQPEVRGSNTEGIKVSCPLPNHPDSNPSAWINLAKQVWFCGGCQLGGDIYDLAAIGLGYDMGTYKNKSDFPVLRKQLAEEFGYTILSGIQGEHVVKNEPEPEDDKPEPVAPTQPEPAPPVEAPAPHLATVTPITSGLNQGAISAKYEHDDNDDRDLYIPWDEILPYETFARSWMEETTVDDLPHEFYFGLALQALGFAAGRNNILTDFQDVKANLYICLYGKTGLGKSRSMRPFLRLIEEVFPFAGDQHANPDGVRILPTPGSGEALIDSFRWDVLDPSTNKLSHHASVSGLVRHEELSGLISKAARSGSSIKEVLMEMYDVHGGDVTTHSRTAGISRAHDPFCQMISTTQPNAIHAFLRRVDIESGFLNRWLFMAGVPRIAPLGYGTISQDITKPAQILKDTNVWARGGHRFILQEDALDAWLYFFNKELAPFKSGEVAQESIFSRVDLLLKKIIICLTVDERREQPTGDIVERAVRLYPYLRTTYSMFAKDLTFNDVTDCQNQIFKMIEEKELVKGPVSKRDLVRALSRKFDGETIVRSLRNLLDLELLSEKASPAGTKGRPTIRYVIAKD